MNESIHKYMKVGIIHFMAYPSTMKGEGPITETVKKIAADEYFDVIEITTIKDKAVRVQVKSMLDTSRMTVVYGAQPRLLGAGLDLNDLNEEGRRKAVDLVKDSVDEAYEMGAKSLAFLSGKYDDASREQALDALVRSTKEICAYAGQKGDLKICLEVFDYDIDKKSLIGPAALADRYAREVKKTYKDFGLLVDLSHLPLLRETARESIMPVKDHLVHVHIGNAVAKGSTYDAYGDVHPRFGFPHGGNDVNELAEFLGVLLDIGYLNTLNPPVVSFEVKPWKDEDPDIVIANSKRTLNEAWARL